MNAAEKAGMIDAMEKVALQRKFNPEQKKQMHEERRDPRMYSNLRGALTMESKEKRQEAHKKLKPGTRETKREAFREGWSRGAK